MRKLSWHDFIGLADQLAFHICNVPFDIWQRHRNFLAESFKATKKDTKLHAAHLYFFRSDRAGTY